MDSIHDLETRMERGMQILQTNGITRNADGTLSVPSQRTGESSYRVDIERDQCTCPDFVHRHVTCKHIHAASLWALMNNNLFANHTTSKGQDEEKEVKSNRMVNEEIRCPTCRTLIRLEIYRNRVIDLGAISA